MASKKKKNKLLKKIARLEDRLDQLIEAFTGSLIIYTKDGREALHEPDNQIVVTDDGTILSPYIAHPNSNNYTCPVCGKLNCTDVHTICQ